jgi:hypothetical protein
MIEKIKARCRYSATIAWSYLLLAAGALMEVVPYAADIVADPSVSEPIKAALPTHWVALYTIGVAVVTYACRLRSLKS